MNLRPYQEYAVTETLDYLQGCQRVLGVAATGAGKTVIFSEVARRHLNLGGKRVLVLAHRQELVAQAVDKLRTITGHPVGVEMGDQSADGDEPIVVSSIQSMVSRLSGWPRDHFSLIIADEAHHITSDSWQGVINHFTGDDWKTHVFGVTATPDRTDAKVLGSFFQVTAFQVSMLDLVKDGYLVNIAAKKLDVKVNLRALAGKREIPADDAAFALEPHIDEVARCLAKEAAERKLMVFLPDVAVSRKMERALHRAGMMVRHVSGESRDRAQVLEWFSHPGPRALCNAMLLTEGFDQPDVDAICCLRPTKSRQLYAQIVGRGMRTAPGKENLLLLDPLWLTGDHNLCEPADLVTTNRKLRPMVQGGFDNGRDMMTAEAEARRTLEASLESALRAAGKKRTPKGLVNPLVFALAMGDGDLADWEPTLPWHELPPTPRHITLLKEFHVHIIEGLTAGLADALIARIEKRAMLGLATPRQLQLMRRMGHPSPDIVSSGEAGHWIRQRLSHFRR